MKLNNIEEKVVYWYMILSWLLYFMGALYITGPIVGWFLAYRVFYRSYKENLKIHFMVWLWVIGMIMLEIAMIIGLNNFGVNSQRMINATIFEWARQGALFATFILAGSLDIRPKVIYRSVAIFCIQGLLFTIIFAICTVAGVPSPLYMSPLKVLGRGGDIYYNISISAAEEAGELRMDLFSGWAPGASFILSCFFFMVKEETNKTIKYIGLIGTILMNVVTISRLGIICLPATIALVYLIKYVKYPITQIGLGFFSLIGGLLAPQIYELFTEAKEQFTGARASSSRVRENLANIGIYRWKNEAPIWGHGEIDLVNHNVVARMPIGSHHHYVGLLFTKGLVGFFSFLIPFAASGMFYFIHMNKNKTNEVAFSIFMVMLFFSFGETLESLAYLLGYPLMIMSIAFKEANNDNNFINKEKTLKQIC